MDALVPEEENNDRTDIANIRIAEVIKDSPFPMRNCLRRSGRKPPPYPMGTKQNDDFLPRSRKTCAYGTLSHVSRPADLAQRDLHPFAVGMAFLRNGSTIGVAPSTWPASAGFFFEFLAKCLPPSCCPVFATPDGVSGNRRALIFVALLPFAAPLGFVQFGLLCFFSSRFSAARKFLRTGAVFALKKFSHAGAVVEMPALIFVSKGSSRSLGGLPSFAFIEQGI